MAMLAEPRRKQRWTLNPRGKEWSEDSTKFGQKMLEKMGWSSGKGLGRNLDGMTEHIRAKYKNDQGGIGFSSKDAEKKWTQHQAGFNELLQQLQSGEEDPASAKESELSGKSLELKSKQSRARVHYKKFTRGKDVNKYSSKDLANIFGKKEMIEQPEQPEQVEVKQEIEEPIPEPVGSSEVSYGILTIKGGSIADYFKNRMSALGRKTVHEESNGTKNDSESEEEKYTGFGFVDVKPDPEKSTDKKNYVFENSAFEDKKPEVGVTPVKVKSEYVFDNPAFEDKKPEVSVTPVKVKSEYVFENPALDLSDSPKEESTPRRIKSEFAFENAGLDLDQPEERTPSGSKKSKTRFVEDIDESSIKTEHVETSGKKKRKKKSSEISEGFTNEALNLEVQDDLETTTNTSLFEVPRSNLGLANDGLDLTDESSGKKRVTFNETVEYESDAGTSRGKKRKHKNGKLDKFEVNNEKLRKKRKKDKKPDFVPVECIFVNEGMDNELMSQEANDNAVNERKMEKEKRKRDRRRSNLETIEEAPEEDKEDSSNAIEVVNLDDSIVVLESNDNSESTDVPKSKKKKKTKDKRSKNIKEEENLSSALDEIEFLEEIPSVDVKVDKIVKKRTADEIQTVVEINYQETEKKTKKRKKEVLTNEANIIDECSESPEATRENNPKRAKGKSKQRLDKENFEVILEEVESGEPEKKPKKKKKKTISDDIEIAEENVDLSTIEDQPKNTPVIKKEKSVDVGSNAEATSGQPELLNNVKSPWDSKGRSSKRIFKALFAKSPVLNFAGSNINEIKGYGMDHI